MTVDQQPADLAQRLSEVESHNALLRESLTDLELAAEDTGWKRISAALEHEFTRQGLADVTRNCRVMAIASPLIKRGLQLRIGYVWGQGVTVEARDDDVNDVVQTFWDDESNQAAFTSSQAQEENERALGTDGNFFLAFFANPLTGRVQVRSTPFDEIVDVIANPEDRDEPWFYLRQYTTTVLEAGYTQGRTRRRSETRRMLHPALGFRPRTRLRNVDGIPVNWDAPILHVPVNRLDGWKWGVPDAYAALPWARAYDGFLTDWARLVKALSKFAWRLTGDRGSRARRAASTLQATVPAAGQAPLPGPSGAVAAMGPGMHLEAIPKSGATIDSESGRPLAAMVAAGLGVPVTMLLADPGTTGARATAETLDQPLVLEAGMRRSLWASVISTATSYVIDQAVKAPRGPLAGTVVWDLGTDRETITLAGDAERTVEVSFPPLDELDAVKLIEALERADTLGAPRGVLVRLALLAVGVKDVDEIMDRLTDDDGNFIDPDVTAAAAAVEAHRRGGDPAGVL